MSDSPNRESSEAIVVSTDELHLIGARVSLGGYLKGLWRRRHFIVAESRAKAYGSIKNTFLGKIWLILDPFLNAGVYYVIFAVLLGLDRGIENFVGYLVVGTAFFAFLSKQLGGGAGIISGGQNLIRAFTFPRAALVFSFTLRTIIDFVPTILATIVFIIIMPPHALPALAWLLFPLVFAIAVPFGMGLAFIAATLTTLVSDLKFIWPLITRFWFYGSGVFWSVDMFAAGSTAQTVMMINPGWIFLELCRETLVYAQVPELTLWLQFAAWSAVIFLIGFAMFWLNEDKFGERNDR